MIRSATQADRASVWRILEPVIREGETYALDSDMGEEDALTYWMKSPDACFVAEDDGQVVGTYYLRPNQGGGGSHICNCGYMVSPEARGRGTARAMCEHSLAQAREFGFRAMQFNFVVASNAGAIGLWQRLGFEVVGRIPDAFEHPRLGMIDALVMHRTL